LSDETSPTPEPEGLDPEALARLDSLGGGALVFQIFGLVLEQGPARVVGAWDGHRRGDLQAIRLAAHSICSSAGNVGATRLLARAREVEALALDATDAELLPGQMEAALAALEDEWGRIQGLLEAWRERFA
jgi:two-component system sensor histidine kinase/response regulator